MDERQKGGKKKTGMAGSLFTQQGKSIEAKEKELTNDVKDLHVD